MISDARMERALAELVETDESSAELKTDVERKAWLLEQVKSKMFLIADGNVAERKAKAEVSPEVIEATQDWLTAYVASKKVEAKRATNELIIRTWQTASANKRVGNI